MKAAILLIFILAISPCVGQQSFYVKAGIGQSKHFNYDYKFRNLRGTSLSPVLSGGADATLELSKLGIISPYAGLGVSFLGTMHKECHHPAFYPGKIFRFRHIYLTLPVGFSIPVYESFGVDVALINGWRLNDRWSEYLGNPRIWDVAIQPGLFHNFDNWRLGISYYYGIRDVFGIGKLSKTGDFRFYNHAIHFNFAYKVRTFGKK